jgi:aminoglycoside phosphotransferase (APT) family kinase protein
MSAPRDAAPPEGDRAAKLAEYFARKLGAAGLRIAGWRLASQGMSDDTILVTLAPAAGEAVALVVRRHREAGVAPELRDVERQYRLLRALGGTDVPVAEALWYEPDPAVLGAPFFVMRRVPGEVPIPWSPEGRAFLARVGDGPTGERFVEVLAAIHRIDWRARGLAFLPRAEPPEDFARLEVEGLARIVRRYRREPEPILEDALGWLAAHARPTPRTTLVHGDYRTGNLVYDDDRIAAVLDWEFACVGDPMLDVAWVCARSNRMESDRVCYLLPRERFLERYERATGFVRDEATLRFWEVFHQVRNAVIWLSAAEAWAAGRTRDLRLARWALTLPTMRRLVAELLEYP